MSTVRRGGIIARGTNVDPMGVTTVVVGDAVLEPGSHLGSSPVTRGGGAHRRDLPFGFDPRAPAAERQG